jgi:hypothetical protein
MQDDDWRWHMYDTVKGSDWLGDQDAIVCPHPLIMLDLTHRQIALYVQRSATRNPRTRSLWDAVLANR